VNGGYQILFKVSKKISTKRMSERYKPAIRVGALSLQALQIIGVAAS